VANSDITLHELLTLPGVTEHCDLASPKIGVMAYHGGELEKVTDVVAHAVANKSGASLYMVTQDFEPLHHIASARVSPDHSQTFAEFVGHVDVAITIHGYGLKERSRAVLLGGQNRSMATDIAQALRPELPEYEFCDDIEDIPMRLRGLHPNNPVNLPTGKGVQIELPPVLRWHMQGWHWSDHGPDGRAPDTQTFIDVLANYCAGLS
jgi:phage replication-related protein YjqB (UPF0714/DUF867 family)